MKNPDSLQAGFARSAASYDNAAVLAREVGRRLGERLGYARLAPLRIADIGCATGDGIRDLQQRFPAAVPLAIDYAWPMLAVVRERAGWWARVRGKAPACANADVRALPLASGSLDLVWSNLMLHWLTDLPSLQIAFAELHRVLAVDGLLHFAMFGPDTLKELRALGAPVPAFPDMHDVGDLLAAAGFADPVMEMEMLTLTYPNARLFLADQRQLGVRDGLLGHLPWRQWRRIFAQWQREGGVLPARFEIVYGHAWKVAPRTTDDGRAIVRFQPRA